MSIALITGASRGFGLALGLALADEGWSLVVDARTEPDLARAATALRERGAPAVEGVAGSVADPGHRRDLAAAVERLSGGGLDLLVNNASRLGASPLPSLSEYPLETLRAVFDVNVMAPLALTQLLLPALRAREGVIVDVTSDASVEAYDGWGGYGASKAALDQLTAVLAVEEPRLHVYAFDPGDMRTRMHQEAFPGEDISDRPEPASRVPALLGLLDRRPASGRYRAGALLPAEVRG